MASFHLTLLGGFQARLGSGPALALPTKKAQGLLAYLALPAGRAHPRDKLATLLWGDSPEHQARNSLRQALFALRRALPAGGVRVEGDAVALAPAALEVDVAAFERGVAEGTPAALAAAVPLYRGDLLAGLSVEGTGEFEEWLLGERERLRELALEALAKLLAHQRIAGATEAAIQTGLMLLGLDPLQEPAHRALMRLYAQAGRRAAALRQYQACVTVLGRELGVEPEAETKQLYQEILRRRDEAPASRTELEARRAPPRARPEPVATETPLIGRDVELAALREALAEAGSGRGGTVAILGEAGVGKSRLLEELAQAARWRGDFVLVGRCYESEQILPFGPWVDAVRKAQLLGDADLVAQLGAPWRAELARLFPELSEPGLPPPAAPADQLGLFEAIVHLVNRVAARQPLALLLEDLHWADEMSCRLLSFLGRRIRTHPVLLVGTAREEELAGAAAFRHGLQELARDEHLLELRLSALSQPDTALLVRRLARTGLDDVAVARLGERVWKASQGNPFVVVETMRALQEGPTPPSGLPLPQRVRDMIAGRLERLTERSQQLAQVAAVIGREFEFALLQRAGGLGEREAAAGVEELVRRRVLRGVDDRFDFTHDRIREVVYDRLVPLQRRLLHRHVAEAIEALHAADLGPHCAALGVHYREGGVWERAFACFRQAGGQAAARSAHREGVACFEEALKALTRLPESRENLERAIDLQFELRNSLLALGEDAQIFRCLTEAEALATRLNDRPRLGRASSYLNRYLWQIGDHPAALASGHRALDIANQIGDAGLRVVASFYLGVVYHSVGRYRDAIDLHRRTVADLGTSLTTQRYGLPYLPAVFARAWLAWSLAELGEFSEGAGPGREAIELAETVDQPWDCMVAYWGMGLFHLTRGEVPEATALLERSLVVCRRRDFPRWLAVIAALLGYAYALSGRTSEGLTLLQEAVAQPQGSAHHCRLLGYLSEAYMRAGRTDDALSHAGEALALAQRRGELGWEAWIHRLLGEIGSESHPLDDPATRASYERALAIAGDLGMRPLAAHCHLGLGKIYGRLGKREKAGEHRGTAMAMYRGMDMRFWLEKAEAAVREMALPAAEP